MISEVGYHGPLLLRAFDHRGVVKDAAGERASDAKRLVDEGFGFRRGASGAYG